MSKIKGQTNVCHFKTFGEMMKSIMSDDCLTFHNGQKVVFDFDDHNNLCIFVDVPQFSQVVLKTSSAHKLYTWLHRRLGSKT